MPQLLSLSSFSSHRQPQVPGAGWESGCRSVPVSGLGSSPVSGSGLSSVSASGGGSGSTPREALRRFLLLKVVKVLLFPCGAVLPLLVGCVFSLQALLLLRSPHLSTKPSTVLLGQLALIDTLLLLHWGLRLGLGMEVGLGLGMEVGLGLGMEVGLGNALWRPEALCVLCQGLLDAHHLASLLLLGLLGLEAMLVSRWPLQTRRLRTAHSARLACTLVWTLVLFKLLVLQASQLHHSLVPHSADLTPPDPQTVSVGMAAALQACASIAPLLRTVSICLKWALWLANAWLHYAVLYCKPQRRKSFFH